MRGYLFFVVEELVAESTTRGRLGEKGSRKHDALAFRPTVPGSLDPFEDEGRTGT